MSVTMVTYQYYIIKVFLIYLYLMSYFIDVFIYFLVLSCTEKCRVFKGHLYIQEKVSQQDRCPFITGVPSSQVSLHHRCPFITKALTWG